MSVKVLNQTKDSIEFEVAGNDVVFSNALRRVIISRIPVLAIEKVGIHKNNSSLYNEILAHRLGLIPLVFNPKEFVSREECKCKKGCEKCRVVFVLDKKGPCTVYASDLKSSNAGVKPLDLHIAIIKLLENQEVKLDAEAVLGIGREHAKWIPAIVGYRYYADLNVDKNRCKKCRRECIKACPKGIIGNNLKLKDNYKCDLCNDCAEACPEGALKVEGDRKKVIIKVTSTSGLSPIDIVNKAIEVEEAMLKEFEKAAKDELK